MLRLHRTTPVELARRFRLQVLARYGVDVHIGIASTWSLAAMASARTGASGILHVEPTEAAVTAFLAPLPVEALHGIGPVQAATLKKFGLHTIAALAAVPEATVQRVLGGRAGRILSRCARGIDARSVTPRRLPESTSARYDFALDTLDSALVRSALLYVAVTLAERLRHRRQGARGLTLTVGFAGGVTVSRTRKLPEASAHTEDLETGLCRILDAMAFQRAASAASP
ncbi:hypothetical protein ACIQMR_35885 [Streptomyces sp. NPDC091376]|uniref:DNA polymerase Y family protein n=1 Tax=Streptomyces sp. NPDC091376 TaxID=3365994 RepID=UPI0037F824F2